MSDPHPLSVSVRRHVSIRRRELRCHDPTDRTMIRMVSTRRGGAQSVHTSPDTQVMGSDRRLRPPHQPGAANDRHGQHSSKSHPQDAHVGSPSVVVAVSVTRSSSPWRAGDACTHACTHACRLAVERGRLPSPFLPRPLASLLELTDAKHGRLVGVAHCHGVRVARLRPPQPGDDLPDVPLIR